MAFEREIIRKLDQVIESQAEQKLKNIETDARLQYVEKHIQTKADKRGAIVSGVVSLAVAVITTVGSCMSHGCGPVPEAQHPTTDQVLDARLAVVRVHEFRAPDGDEWVGTAWFVSPSELYTAGHMCGDKSVIKLELKNGDILDARVESKQGDDGIKDICKLQVDYRSDHYLKIATVDPVLGEHLWYVGYPALRLSVLDGRALVYDDAGFLEASVPLTGGASGSALLNERGEVVGMLVEANLNFVYQAYAIPWSKL